RASLPRGARGPARPGEPGDGHRRRQGHAAAHVARRLPAGVLDAARCRRLLLRQRVRHDRALLATLRERAPGSLRRRQPRAAAAGGATLAAYARARSRHAGAGARGHRRAALPSRSRQRRLRLCRADRGPRGRRGRGRHHGGRARAGRSAERVRPAARGPGPVIAPAELAREVAAAREASVRLARRPRRQVAAALAAAAASWRADASLHDELPALARLSPSLGAAGPAIAGAALDADGMTARVERELAGAPPPRPWLVAHVLASNVPALALPAIALGCLAGAAVLVKSGRADPCSAPA